MKRNKSLVEKSAVNLTVILWLQLCNFWTDFRGQMQNHCGYLPTKCKCQPNLPTKILRGWGFCGPLCRASCTCTLMSGEAVALNAHVLLPELVKSVFKAVDRRCCDDMLRKSIPVRHHSLAQERSTNVFGPWRANLDIKLRVYFWQICLATTDIWWLIIVARYRYPSSKNVRELLYKHGHGSVDGRRTPLTSNADIEKVLGRLNFCVCP